MMKRPDDAITVMRTFLSLPAIKEVLDYLSYLEDHRQVIHNTLVHSREEVKTLKKTIEDLKNP